MKIKRINKLEINSFHFDVKWNKSHNGGSFSYSDREIEIGTKGNDNAEIFHIICHELMELATVEMNVRLRRPDCDTDYIFVYDHRQHETIMCMFSNWLSKFIDQ